MNFTWHAISHRLQSWTSISTHFVRFQDSFRRSCKWWTETDTFGTVAWSQERLGNWQWSPTILTCRESSVSLSTSTWELRREASFCPLWYWTKIFLLKWLHWWKSSEILGKSGAIQYFMKDSHIVNQNAFGSLYYSSARSFTMACMLAIVCIVVHHVSSSIYIPCAMYHTCRTACLWSSNLCCVAY